jgi:hypothetical protein
LLDLVNFNQLPPPLPELPLVHLCLPHTLLRCLLCPPQLVSANPLLLTFLPPNPNTNYLKTPQILIPILSPVISHPPPRTERSTSVTSVQRLSLQVAIYQDMPAFTRESGIINVHFQGAILAALVRTIFSNSEHFPLTRFSVYPCAQISLTVNPFSYRIHLTPGSRRNSTSARSQVLSGIKKQVKVPPTREASLDSPPLTPPALEQAFVPRVYSASEPSPPLSALPCPSAQEYLEQQDYQDATTPSRYFDPRGPPCRPVDASRPSVPEQLLLNPPCPSAAMGGLRPDSCDNTSGTEHGSYSPQNHIFVPPSGGLLMTGSHAINGMSNPFSIYGAYAPPTHPPPNQVPSTRSSDVSIHANVSLVEPQPQSDLRSTQAQSLRTVIATNPPHLSPVPSSNSPSPVSSLSISSHSSDHSPLLYQKPNFPIPPANGVTYGLPGPPQSTQLQAPATERYHPSQLISEIYNRVNPTASWQSSISDARRNPAVHGEGAEFVL